MPDLTAKYLKVLAPYLWQGEQLADVLEVSADPKSARRHGVLAVTNLRVLVLMEIRPGTGLKTTLRTWSFRLRSLSEVTGEGALVRLRSAEQTVEVVVTGAGDRTCDAAAASVVAHLQALAGGATPKPAVPPSPPKSPGV